MTYNPFSLEGKKILVTGASSGIGQVIAISCSRMGAEMIITGRNAERLNQTFSNLEGNEQRNHLQITADLLVQAELENLVSQIDKIDGLVLCAGIANTTPFQFCTPEKFRKIFETNFFSTIELLRFLYKKKKIADGGSVVIISSVSANRSDFGNSMYGSSKAALNAMMRYCAKELAMKNIRINTVMPGLVWTPLIEAEPLAAEKSQENKEKYPLKRYGRPEDIANGVIYLLSEASSWVTGTSLVIDGGISIG